LGHDEAGEVIRGLHSGLHLGLKLVVHLNILEEKIKTING
jgi:hypothetical protein